jgi:hypothetical protein
MIGIRTHNFRRGSYPRVSISIKAKMMTGVENSAIF